MAKTTLEKWFTPARILTGGFATLILIGGVLLSLPFASNSGEGLNFLDALFTATSATCVTGLVVVDTLTQFNLFGQLVILSLIQIGGLGFMTVTTFIIIFTGRRIGLRERLVIQEALNVNSLEGVIRLARNIVLITVAIELFFAAILAFRFSMDMPVDRAIYYGIFHAISSFCNAGFDLFGNFRSLTGYVTDPTVNIVVMILIILGGLGFTVMVDVWKAPRPEKLSLHTKLVLTMTATLLIAGAIGYYLLEMNNPKTLGPLAWNEKLLAAMFASTTARTAGYATIDYGSLTDASLLWTILLMFIGASPGSTGGGIKTVTTIVILLYVISILTGKESTVAFRKRLDPRTVHKSFAVAVISAILLVTVTFALTLTEDKEFIRLLFEATSAFGTVGLSTNLTPELTPFGRIIVMLMMFAGRVGPVTLALALTLRAQQKAMIKYPEEKLFVG
ncbi:TrkH family potassium uptake protein [Effusibacillus lacus]|uniref:ATP synthase subunit J n=1 Tax=Effusibacillus lacus TaxID=1348429 RepID=A0A292YPF6_9BACL|nr:TrkH family potassium uptake protein [Effusibacillus lacus]TCS70655.1 trk system potassium uptake protein TrkH [Effusibacillus lacus]GAX90653.1 ATP synthase subunit J [Effusibacillus lacus]